MIVLATSAPFSCHLGWTCYAGYGVLPWLGTMHESFVLGNRQDASRDPSGSSISWPWPMSATGPRDRWASAWPGCRAIAPRGHGGPANPRGFPGGTLVRANAGRSPRPDGARVRRYATLVNIGGSVGLIAVAAVVGWFKRAPWNVRSAAAEQRSRAENLVEGAATQVPAGSYGVAFGISRPYEPADRRIVRGPSSRIRGA